MRPIKDIYAKKTSEAIYYIASKGVVKIPEILQILYLADADIFRNYAHWFTNIKYKNTNGVLSCESISDYGQMKLKAKTIPMFGIKFDGDIEIVDWEVQRDTYGLDMLYGSLSDADTDAMDMCLTMCSEERLKLINKDPAFIFPNENGDIERLSWLVNIEEKDRLAYIDYLYEHGDLNLEKGNKYGRY